MTTDFQEQFDKLIEKAYEMFPQNLEVDSYIQPCDCDIKPIYPVRYAYVNFFGKELEKPEAPPDIHTLMFSSSLQQTKGYAARLLRPGWIYIKEEDPLTARGSKARGYLHIFKYCVSEKEVNGKKQRVEKFRKYMFLNRRDASEGLIPEPGIRGEGHSFLFVAKDVINISIAYSEHPWHSSVLAKIDSSLELRQKTMQFINLEQKQSPFAVNASDKYFRKLIVDYKIRQEQFANIKSIIEKDINELDLADVSIDTLTTQDSYEMDAGKIIQEINSYLHFNEQARIVILHDPVGRQRDIVEAYSILNLWQQSYNASNIYPLTIGFYVEKLKATKNPELKKKIDDSIDSDAWENDWPKLKKVTEDFEARQAMFMKLFEAFADNPDLSYQVGGLQNYFHYFFSLQDKKQTLEEEDALEFRFFSEILSGLLGNLQSSLPGQQVLAKLVAKESDSNGDGNFWRTITTGVVTVLNNDKVKSPLLKGPFISGVDNILLGMGTFLATVCAYTNQTIYQGSSYVRQIPQKAIDQITQQLVPALLSTLGVVIEPDGRVALSEQSYQEVLKRLESKTNRNRPDPAVRQQAIGERMINWSKRLESLGNKPVITLPEVKTSVDSPVQLFTLEGANKTSIGLLFDSSLTGVSLFLNAFTLSDVIMQTEYARNNPLQPGSSYMNLLRFSTAVIGMSADLTSIGSTLASKVNSPIVKALMSGIKVPAVNASAVSQFSRVAGSVAGYLGAIISFCDASNAFKVGNDAEGYSLIAIGTGSTILTTAIWIGVAVGSFLTAGVLTAIIVGAGLLIGGSIVQASSAWSDLEKVLNNCFWGAADKYAFWDKKKVRPAITVQLKKAREMSNDTQNHFIIENQEFLNLFIQPQLKIHKEYRKTIYRFTLPAFQMGVSEIYGLFIKENEIYYLGAQIIPITINRRQYTQDTFRDATFKAAREQAKLTLNGNTATLEIVTTEGREVNPYRSKLYWYYQQSENVIAPLRYFWGEKPTTENTIKGSFDGEFI
ncbi:toxin VasX [Photorhabdus akhurstii]|uniref:toxin VasX n=1 Tax=Photorhabdus akhurstii TaxID=171438 RepID=UPI003704A2D6